MHAAAFYTPRSKLKSPVYDIVCVHACTCTWCLICACICYYLHTFFLIHVYCLTFSSVSWESLPRSHGDGLPGMTTVKSIASSIYTFIKFMIFAMICIIISG